jgi:predicted RNase H-like HicB family nuclease
MTEPTTIKDYDIHVYWDSRAEYFVAEIQDIYTCAADGATQAEALANLEETFAVLKEAYAEEKLPFPRPSPDLPITIGELSALSDVVKISRLAELSGISGQTLATKMRRGTEFSADESGRIARALGSQGLALMPAHFARAERVSGHLVGEKPVGDYSVRAPSRSVGTKSKRGTSMGAKRKGSGRQRGS